MTKRLILAVSALFASVLLLAQAPTGGVKGTVINRNGRQSIENAKLTLLQGAQEIATVQSGPDGTFLIPGLQDGRAQPLDHILQKLILKRLQASAVHGRIHRLDPVHIEGVLVTGPAQAH